MFINIPVVGKVVYIKMQVHYVLSVFDYSCLWFKYTNSNYLAHSEYVNFLPFIYILPQSAWFARRHSLSSVRYVLCQSCHGDDRKHIDAIARDYQKKSAQQISAGHPYSLRARGTGEDTHKDVRFFKNLSYKLMFEFCPFYVVFVQ